MAKEIERKFLVNKKKWIDVSATGIIIKQGYLSTSKTRTVRVRTIDRDAFITIKGITEGVSRTEYEYKIPYHDATEMIDIMCKTPIISKIRYKVIRGNNIWEVDKFLGDNKGLMVAEIEFKNEKQKFKKPDWVGKEVSNDPRYFNSNLLKHPYKNWKKGK